MRTLYVRNVPDEVVDRLEQLAARERSSVNAVVLHELENVARRTRNAEIFASMPDTDVTTEEIRAAIAGGRR
jgi:predicted transcriptional regulator